MSTRPRIKHDQKAIAEAATLFFTLRGLVRSRLAQGRKLDPYAWLRIETMVYIRDHEGTSMKELADYLAITAPSTTSIIGALEKADFVARIKDSRDKRVLRLSLTKKGKNKLEKAVALGMQSLASVFEPLSASELRSFSSVLARMVSSAHGSGTRGAD